MDSPNYGMPGPGIAPADPAIPGIEMVIPYKNGKALTAYYLGIFSIICGAFLGIPALILGIMGIKEANAHPEVRGKVHAWVGVILGAFMTLVTIAAFFVILIPMLAAARH